MLSYVLLIHCFRVLVSSKYNGLFKSLTQSIQVYKYRFKSPSHKNTHKHL